jgi:hypothetical protein
MTSPYEQFQGSHLWRGLVVALRELQANGEVELKTSDEHVVGYLCQELVARGLVTLTALEPRR